ncbi:MAG TPA: CPCC family cysteine-rich protein [Desulfosporosinus sp.]|nr:CPCC family cysteine-rich protein [Desulfosporosinus sp.]
MAGKYKCACCGQDTITEPDFYEICPICGWEDDDLQRNEPDYRGGANEMSLNEAKEAYKRGKEVY